VINGDFIEGIEAVYFSDADEFRLKLRQMLEDASRTEKIGRTGRQAVLTRHLSRHRAAQVLEGLL
ncbi:MAG: glycosyltransferase, partial [Nitrososphaera sp.]|nr:glycosyltransferase [Nitrososphaera sp.]